MTATYDAHMWKVLTTAACGRRVIAMTWYERGAKEAFGRYVSALESIGLDKSLWTAHGANGNHAIRFENGGEIRFVSHMSPHLDGRNIETVVMDA